MRVVLACAAAAVAACGTAVPSDLASSSAALASDTACGRLRANHEAAGCCAGAAGSGGCKGLENAYASAGCGTLSCDGGGGGQAGVFGCPGGGGTGEQRQGTSTKLPGMAGEITFGADRLMLFGLKMA